jgi:hypothetical protein
MLAGVASYASGQAITGAPHELWGAVGLVRTSERDASASPLLYRGTGFTFAGGYAHSGAMWRSELQMDVNSYGIGAVQTPQLPAHADLFRLGGQASAVRALRMRPKGVRSLAGVVVMGSTGDRNEQLVNGETRLYRNYLVSLGAVLRGELAVSSGGTFAYQLALPLLSGITHPAADVRVLGDPATRRLRWRGVGSYREAEQRLSYTHPVASRGGLRTTLMSDLYADASEPQRAGARTAMTVAAVLWLGPMTVSR